jgi:NADPH-dependent 2,4-dienoyl-CoA reductase/sulfur reductase-like enzyme/pSer/pThr/pTyr-binding forkhead associated (FHA) protein
MRKRFVIIGDGAAGLSAAQTLRRLDRAAAIAILSDEPHPGYFRAALTNYLLGELRPDQLWATVPDFYEANQITRVMTRVIAVDPAARRLWETSSPVPLDYDALLIASGARARAPGFHGAELAGVMTLRTLCDVRRVVDWITLFGLRSAVVVGGGPLGLEWAHGLKERGVAVTVLERQSRFLPRVLDQVGSDLLAARLRQAGIGVRFGAEVVAAHPDRHGRVAGLVLNTSEQLPCELIAFAAGIVPNTEFLRSSGIVLSDGAVRVDRSLQTSAAGVWAAGDVAVVDGERLGLWEPARRQAEVAARNMVDLPTEYRPGAHYFATRLFDLDFAAVGSIASDATTEDVVDFPRGTGRFSYRKLVLRDGRLQGALLLGERSTRVRASGRALKRLIDAGLDVRPIRERLLDPGFDFEGYLETHRMLDRPSALPSAPVPSAARLRATQLLSTERPKSQSGGTLAVADLGASAAALTRRATHALMPAGRTTTGATAALAVSTGTRPSATLAVASRITGPRQTHVLSIGLHAEGAPPPLTLAVPLDAWLEGPQGRLAVSGSVVNIGREAACDIVLVHASVAGVHAEIARSGAGLYLRDLGSSSGTWIDRRPLVSAHALRDGDRIGIGEVELVFRCPVLPRASVAAAERGAPRLELTAGGPVGLSFSLAVSPAVIGRDPSCHIVLDHPHVSGRHASLREQHGRHYLCDLTSGSGSFARGVRLQPGQELLLEEAERFVVGAVELRYTTSARAGAAERLRARGRLVVQAGAELGRALELGAYTRVGGDPRADLVLPGSLAELEITGDGRGFLIRDLTASGTFRSGSPLGSDKVSLDDGDVLLLPGGAMLRFEEAR